MPLLWKRKIKNDWTCWRKWIFTLIKEWKNYRINTTIPGKIRKAREGTWVFGGGIEMPGKYFLYGTVVHRTFIQGWGLYIEPHLCYYFVWLIVVGAYILGAYIRSFAVFSQLLLLKTFHALHSLSKSIFT